MLFGAAKTPMRELRLLLAGTAHLAIQAQPKRGAATHHYHPGIQFLERTLW